MIDAIEEKSGAPSTPGLSKSTVAASVIEVQADMGKATSPSKQYSGGPTAAKTLHKSLDSRRSSGSSRRNSVAPLRTATSDTSVASANAGAAAQLTGPSNLSKARVDPRLVREESGSNPRADAKVFEVVRQDLLLGP